MGILLDGDLHKHIITIMAVQPCRAPSRSKAYTRDASLTPLVETPHSPNKLRADQRLPRPPCFPDQLHQPTRIVHLGHSVSFGYHEFFED